MMTAALTQLPTQISEGNFQTLPTAAEQKAVQARVFFEEAINAAETQDLELLVNMLVSAVVRVKEAQQQVSQAAEEGKINKEKETLFRNELNEYLLRERVNLINVLKEEF